MEGGPEREPRPPTAALEDPTQFPDSVWQAAGGARDLLTAFAELLIREGQLRGLLGPRELPRLWSRHIVNSLAITGFVPASTDVADIGSGAGFPGLVLAMTRPDVSVTLIDSMERRTAWLSDVAEELELRNVEVVTARAEALHGRRSFRVVTARAVASLDRLGGWALPLVTPGGHLVALKGGRASEELEAARSALRRSGGSHGTVVEVPSPLDGSVTRVVLVEKQAPGPRRRR